MNLPKTFLLNKFALLVSLLIFVSSLSSSSLDKQEEVDVMLQPKKWGAQINYQGCQSLDLVDLSKTPVIMNESDFDKLPKKSYPIQHLILLGNVSVNLHKLKWFPSLYSLDLQSTNVAGDPVLNSKLNTQDIEIIGGLTTLKLLNIKGIHISNKSLEKLPLTKIIR